jgi:acetolactate synthase-1/2/3 large subunit
MPLRREGLRMNAPLSRRSFLKGMTAAGLAAATQNPADAALKKPAPGWVVGKMTGAHALVDTLLAEGTPVVFGIPGAQENELWDAMKVKGLPYLLVTHEFSASTAADGVARSTGKPGVLTVIPGPGLTNALSGIGEAWLDSVPLVCIVGDVARGDKYRPFQVHELPQANILKNVTKQVFEVQHQAEIPKLVREAFKLSLEGEPGPVGVVIPYTLFIESHDYHNGPISGPELTIDEQNLQAAIAKLSNPKIRWGIYAGIGCQDYAAMLTQAAEILQAPVATSVSGKGAISDAHPLAVGWGYGPQGTPTAEEIFKKEVDGVLAIGVRYSEVSTAFYNIPQHKHVIHVDANPNNLGRIVKADIGVAGDAGIFLSRVIENADCLRRKPDDHLLKRIAKLRAADYAEYHKTYAKCGVDPMNFILALRRCLCADALVYVDVTVSEHWAAEAFPVYQPRTYFNPTDNQAMGWSIPAAIGGQRVHLDRQVATITGDGCFLMSAMEISTCNRERLPVKFFVFDDQAYHYMQVLQEAAYLQTTATILARLDYAALAQGWGVAYHEITDNHDLDVSIRGALLQDGPVLTRVCVDYRKRPMRWIDATKEKYTKELTFQQKARFLSRIGSRALDLKKPQND